MAFVASLVRPPTDHLRSPRQLPSAIWHVANTTPGSRLLVEPSPLQGKAHISVLYWGLGLPRSARGPHLRALPELHVGALQRPACICALSSGWRIPQSWTKQTPHQPWMQHQGDWRDISASGPAGVSVLGCLPAAAWQSTAPRGPCFSSHTYIAQNERPASAPQGHPHSPHAPPCAASTHHAPMRGTHAARHHRTLHSTPGGCQAQAASAASTETQHGRLGELPLFYATDAPQRHESA